MVVTLLTPPRFIGMNKLRVATVALCVPLILLIAGGTASANPGSGPAWPVGMPDWLWPPYVYLWAIGESLKRLFGLDA